MKGLVVILLGLALVIGGCAAKQNADVTAICAGGPTVKAPVMEKLLDGGASAGDLYNDMATGNQISTTEWIRLMLTIRKVWRLVTGNTVAHMNGKKLAEAERFQRQIDANKQLAVSMCCPAIPPGGQNAPDAPPKADPPPFDPKSLSFQTGLDGAVLAADALVRAGFPADEIPMGVAVARYESTFNPHPKTNPAMRGMWQINWAVHPEVHSMGNAYDPYVNARMAYSIWKAAGSSWSPWSTEDTARRHAGEYKTYGQGAAKVDPLPNAGTEPGTPATPAVCDQPAAAEGESGSTQPVSGFSDGGGPTPASFNSHGNPRTVNQAMAWYQKQVDDKVYVRPNSCANAVARAYGWSNGGCYGPNCSALEVWGAISPKWKHPGKGDPPRGALVFWKTGQVYGHVAVSAGNGMIYTTDVPRARFGLVPIAKIDSWGPRVGWSDPTWPIHTGSRA